MKKKDLVIYALILLLFILSLFFSVLSGAKGNTVKVYVNREIFAEYPIMSDIEFSVNGVDGIELNVIVRDGKVIAVNSNCPDKVCESTGFISKTNESIICLPGKIVISIVSDDASDYDTISR